MQKKATDITLLCKVVDNFGDIGVVYRLARALKELSDAEECSPVTLRLITDNLQSFHSIEPQIDPHKQFQELCSIKVYDWNAEALCKEAFLAEPPQIILECFQCGRPDWLEGLLFDTGFPEIVHIIMIDYLTAEDYAETFHRLMSLTRSARVEKVNFMPGFTPKTGGLILDQNFMQSLKKSKKHNQEFFNILFFTYERNWLPAMQELAVFAKNLDKPINLYIAQGRGKTSALQAWKNAGMPFKVTELDFLQQCRWDELLCSCPLLFIRGEDSLSRACLSGNPFIWHAYPQSDEYQLVKVQALLDRMQPFFPAKEFETVKECFLSFNSEQTDIQKPLSAFLKNYDRLCAGFRNFALNLQKNGNLAKNLMTFIEERYTIETI